MNSLIDDDDSDDDIDGDEEDAEGEGAEDDPLGSGDDISEGDPSDLFNTENVVVCQYDKITRTRNKWKFHLKDGIMNLNGKVIHICLVLLWFQNHFGQVQIIKISPE